MQGCFDAIQKKYVSHIQPFSIHTQVCNVHLVELYKLNLLTFFALLLCNTVANVVKFILLFCPPPAADSYYVCEYCYANLES